MFYVTETCDSLLELLSPPAVTCDELVINDCLGKTVCPAEYSSSQVVEELQVCAVAEMVCSNETTSSLCEAGQKYDITRGQCLEGKTNVC